MQIELKYFFLTDVQPSKKCLKVLHALVNHPIWQNESAISEPH